MKLFSANQFLVLLFLVFGPFAGYSQITITQSDVLGLLGRNYQFQQTLDDSVAVNVGSPGANQTWDLRNIAFQDTLAFQQVYLLPSATPYDTAFTQANFAAKLNLQDGSLALEVYQYWLVGTDLIQTLGDVSVFYGATDTTTIFEPKVDSAGPLPLVYNGTWTSIRHDTLDFGGGITQIEHDTTFSAVDGWGTLQLPIGDFAVLRIKETNSFRTVFLNNGVPTSEDIEQHLSYIWMNKDHFRIAGADSREGDLDPNFTISDAVIFLSGIDTGVGIEDDLSNRLFTPPTISPNPMQETSRIHFTLHQPAQVQAKIFTLQGQQVASLANGRLQAGKQALSWNGKNEAGRLLPNGLYLINLTAGGDSFSRKIHLLR